VLKIKSPLTNSYNVKFEMDIPVKFIIKAYKKWSIDVAKIFGDIDHISIFKCIDTGYRFYYPFHLSGNEAFYMGLQKLPWYYMDWKWEHENSLKYIQKNNNVLEIGCARGSFLKKLNQHDINCTGLELNTDAIAEGTSIGLNIYNESIQQHSEHNREKYDVVCSFQVMEHIVKINEVIQSSIDSIKKGGLLIISVPNNDSFLKLSTNYLNMPPHHMGLWNEKSLRSLEKIFNLEVIALDFEPLQEYHKNYFIDTLSSHFYKTYKRGGYVINKIFQLTFPLNLFLFNKKFKAFTIQIILRKL
jgi:2-polyprenyl-3-methyl-5-hydroxy-6-metoxy-1,4-benzoquinol methylase